MRPPERTRITGIGLPLQPLAREIAELRPAGAMALLAQELNEPEARGYTAGLQNGDEGLRLSLRVKSGSRRLPQPWSGATSTSTAWESVRRAC